MFHLSQVETIGDAYMVVGGAPEVTRDHTEREANFIYLFDSFSV